MEIKIQKLIDRAVIPEQQTKGAAGFDLHGINLEPIIIPSGFTVKIPTGLAMEIPEGYFGAIYPRSGMATTRGLRLANCTAVIDSDYRGDIMVPIFNDTNDVQLIEPGERLAQMVIQPYLPVTFTEVDTLTPTERGEGGFGSTGTN